MPRLLMAAGALCTVLSAMHSQAAPATLLDTLADTPLGKVQGFIQNKTLLFRGIPYAQPPVGAQRWKSTKPPLKWSHVLDATKYAPACAQFGPAWTSLAPPNSQAPCHNNMAGCVNWTWSNATSEDCLYINVYQAAAASPKPRPVVVYFAAGALEWGSGNDLENSGEGLASKPGWKNVILVTLNYRKGVFGFLASDELRARDGATAGAFGLQDQTMALEWVKSNIASFNGDPNRVTLFGESAGATSVSMHMVMPRSRGLFHGAIMDSGAFNQWTYRPWSDAADLYKTLVKQLGCDAWSEPLDCMLSKDTTTLLNISDTYYGNCSLPHKESLVTTQWAPAMDGVVVPGEPVKLLLAGKAADVPVLLGSNKNEGSTFLNHPPRSSHDFSEFFNATFGNTSGPTLAEAYMPPNATAPPPPSPWGPGKHGWGNMAFHNAAQDAAGDFDLRCPTRMAARVFASQGRPTFLYSYDHPPYESVNQGMPIRSSYLGAFHGAEVPFVFYDDFELKGGELDLSARMATYWTNFASSGDPNQGEQQDEDDDDDSLGELMAPPPPPPPPPHRSVCEYERDCERCAAPHGGPGSGTKCVWCPGVPGVSKGKCIDDSAVGPAPAGGVCPADRCISAPSDPTCDHHPTPATCRGGYTPRPPPPPPRNCTHPQPTVVWPRFTNSPLPAGGAFLELDLCNVTVQHIDGAYRAQQCAVWERVCANPASNLSMACAFNRSGAFPHPP